MVIEFLYPALGYLYGEAAQATFIEKCFPQAEIVKTELCDEPAFTQRKVDLIYLGPLSENRQEAVIKALMPYRDQIENLINGGTAWLATGNALEIFGEYIEREDGSHVDGLGIFPLHAKRDMANRYNSLYLGNYRGLKIVGYKAQFSHSFGYLGGIGAIHTIRGDGINPDEVCEGLACKNFFATYLLGPLLIMNPHFAKVWLKNVTGENVELPFEKDLVAAYERRLREYERRGIKF